MNEANSPAPAAGSLPAPGSTPDDVGEWLVALGLKRLSSTWAKAEILLGLSAATLGATLLPSEAGIAWGGGALVVLGTYLAMAGHRSHIYQAMNRQNSHLARLVSQAANHWKDHP